MGYDAMIPMGRKQSAKTFPKDHAQVLFVADRRGGDGCCWPHDVAEDRLGSENQIV